MVRCFRFIRGASLTLPAQIGASTLRNLDADSTAFVDGVALNIFLLVALMDLKLWQIPSQAIPLVSILVVQLLTVGWLAYFVTFRLMGRDYESAVMASGFIGFAMGTTANAIANMRAWVTRFGAAPRDFRIIPLVGALFIDFANALIVTDRKNKTRPFLHRR